MVVPDLSKMTPDQALAALKQAGWSADAKGLVQTAKEDPNQALWGTITAQNPAVNAKVSKTSVINVTVASEPHVPVPDLKNMTVNQAYDTLSSLGWDGQLRCSVHREITPPAGQANLIFDQSPDPSNLILVTDTVHVDVYPNRRHHHHPPPRRRRRVRRPDPPQAVPPEAGAATVAAMGAATEERAAMEAPAVALPRPAAEPVDTPRPTLTESTTRTGTVAI